MGYTAFHRAIRKKHYTVCMDLLDEGANVSALITNGNSTVRDEMIAKLIKEFKEFSIQIHAKQEKHQTAKKELKGKTGIFRKRSEETKQAQNIKKFDKDCPICMDEMKSLKIFQCAEGHILCEKCYEKICNTTKLCPFCKVDVSAQPIRNRILENIIENEIRREENA